MPSAIQLLGATVGTLAFVDVGRRWGGPYPSPLPNATHRRREFVEIAAIYGLSFLSIGYAIAVFRDVVGFNPGLVPVGTSQLRLVFVLSITTSVVLPAFVELVVRGRSVRDLGLRGPVNWRPAILLVGVGALFGALPLAFGAIGTTTGTALVLGLVGVVEEEFLYRGVVQSKLERVVSQERAWILSGLLFGLSHVPNDFFGPFWVADGGDPLIATLRLTEQIAAGLLYGLFYAKSRSLAAPVFAHFLSNKLAVVVSTVWG